MKKASRVIDCIAGLCLLASLPAIAQQPSAGYNAIVPIEGSFTKYRDATTQAPWLYDGTTFWTYDDPWSIAYKMVYARDKMLGGVNGMGFER